MSGKGLSRENEWLMQAIQLHRGGQLQKARALYERVLKRDPAHAEALHMLGVLAVQSGRPEWAADLIRQAMRIDPHRAEFHQSLGNVLLELDRAAPALACYERALQLDPAEVEARFGRGNALRRMGRLLEALESFREVVSAAPAEAEPLVNLALTLADLDRPEDALSTLDRALALQPTLAAAHHNRGMVLRSLGRLEEALASYDRAIAIGAAHPDVHFNRANTLKELKRFDEALASFEAAARLRPADPEPRIGCASMLRRLNRADDALDAIDTVLKAHPGSVSAHVERGQVYKDLGRIDDALACFDQAIALDPEHAEAWASKAVALLLAGRMHEGWALYEWRLRTTQAPGARSAAPRWDGGSHCDSLLVIPEQGVGDEVFFAGMVPELFAHAKRLIVAADPRLHTLFRRAFEHPGLEVVNRFESLPPADYHVAAGSLGRHFRGDAQGLARIRAPYLSACPHRTAALRGTLQTDGTLLCGISWRSGNAEFALEKSLALRALSPLLSLPRTRWIDLQYGDTRQERASLMHESGIGLVEVESVDNYADLDGLAALIRACDVVVTVSNTTAHLAGALGAKTLVLVPSGCGLLWYWHLNRADSPWYPTLELLRQSADGRWDAAIAQARCALVRLTPP